MSNTFVSGSIAYAEWIHSGGTTVLSGDQRSFRWTPTAVRHDASAGSDAAVKRVGGMKDSTFEFQGILQSDGTAILGVTGLNSEGTIVYGPQGTAANKPKVTMPAIVSQRPHNAPFDGLTDISITWEGNGAYTEGNW